MSSSTIQIGLLLPDVMGTYGDGGNAVVLCQRLKMRGYDAEVLPITLDDHIPDSCDAYTLGGGEDSAQILACRHIARDQALFRAVEKRVPVFAVCAGLQILGKTFQVSDGTHVPGLELLDVITTPQSKRSIGELVSEPLLPQLSEPLTGFENHQGATVLGMDAKPLGHVRDGYGNSVPSGQLRPAEGYYEGVVQGSVIATYMHGPALARNPQLADYILMQALGVDELEPLVLPEVMELRAERLEAAD